MTRLTPAQMAFFVRAQRDELTRIWRLARATARPDVFPGLLDGVMASFFDRAADLLEGGAPPEEVWSGLVGLVRWPPGRAPDEAVREWSLLAEVMAAACESVNVEPAVAEWLTRAIARCQDGTASVRGGRSAGTPAGLVTTLFFSPLSPPLPKADQQSRG